MRTRKALGMALPLLALLALMATPALAVDTSVTYKSGILVLVFLGVLALIVVAQLVPALILMIGFFKAVATAITRKKVAVPEDPSK
jgi:uncharacterized membrane protein